MIHSVFRYRKAFRNWLHVGISIKRGKYPFTAIMRSGKIRTIRTLNEALISSYGIDYSLDEEGLMCFTYNSTPVKLKGASTNGDVAEVFGQKFYDKLRVSNRLVIDIGANIGDTSVYFALNGARTVIAIEPFPQSYALLVQNIEMNDLQSVIIPVNAALSPESGTVRLNESFADTTQQRALDFVSGVLVKKITLEQLVANYNIKECVVKLDCEGCEHDVVMNAPEHVLQMIIQAHIDYHSGFHDASKIAERLRSAGLTTFINNINRRIGVIHCTR